MVTKKKTTKKTTRKKAARKKATKMQVSTKSAEMGNEHVCAVLSYFIIGLIWYFVDDQMKKSKLVTFHVKQVLILVILDVSLWILLSVLSFLWVIAPILYIALCAVWIIGLIYAIQGEEKELPVVGKFASHFKF